MKSDKLLNILKDLGLSDNEAQVYMSTLSLGPTTILALSKASQIRRTTVYPIVESLQHKGLMYTESKGFKVKYVAAAPEKLNKMIESQHDRLLNLLPEFDAIYNTSEDESMIRHYEGIQAVKDIYMDTLNDTINDDDYLVITDQEKWIEVFDSFSEKYRNKRALRRTHVRMLVTDTPTGHNFKKIEKNFHEEIRLFPKNTKLDVDVVITPKRVIIFQIKPPYRAIEIRSKSIILMQKNLFEVIWNFIK